MRPTASPALRRTSNPWGWAVAGAMLGIALVLLVAAPARWLAHAIAQASHGRVLLAEPSGRVWNGSARLVLTGGAGSRDRARLPGRIHWRLRPALDGVQAQVSADCCTPAGPITLHAAPRRGGVLLQVGDGLSHWPAAALAGLGAPFNTIVPQGQLDLATQGLTVRWQDGRLQLQGTGTLTARELSSRLTTLKPMGSYRITVQGGADIRLALATLEGGLLLTGSGQWLGTQLHFRGEARAAPELQAQLANLLNVLGRREGDRAILSFG